jgi:hypothetical protein
MSANASSRASRRRLMAGVVSVATFMLLCAVALPGMETSLVFIRSLRCRQLQAASRGQSCGM